MLFNIYVWQWVMCDLQISYLFWSGLQVPAENTNWLWSESFWYSSESTDRWSSISWSGDTEFKSRSRCRIKCNIIVVKRYMFLHQAYDNGSKSHWSFGWEVETAVGFGTIKKNSPLLNSHVSAKLRSKFRALARQWWRLRTSESLSRGQRTISESIRAHLSGDINWNRNKMPYFLNIILWSLMFNMFLISKPCNLFWRSHFNIP